MTEKERNERKSRIIVNEIYEDIKDKKLVIVTHFEEDNKSPEYNKVIIRHLVTSKTDWAYVDFFHNVYKRLDNEKTKSQ